MKYGEITGPDNISVQMLEAREDISINKLESIMNKMYHTGTIPKSLSKSIFVTLPKKAGASECVLHRTISLMSQIAKLMLKILMKRMKRPIHEEIAGVQCEFFEGRELLMRYLYCAILSSEVLKFKKIHNCVLLITQRLLIKSDVTIV